MKNMVLVITLILSIILIGCKKDPVSSNEPEAMIRLKTGSGLNSGSNIYFLALSKNVDFLDYPGDIFEYDKTEADWYIDGGEIPFITDYKNFIKPSGEYYFMLKASGEILRGKKTVLSGTQTWLIYAEYNEIVGFWWLKIDIEQS